MYERLSCPICDLTDSKTYDKGASYENRRCKNCGTVFLSSKENSSGFSNIYTGDYYQSASHQYGYEDYPALRKAIHKTAKKRFERIEKLITGDKKSVLDAGCACGFYLEAAKERGWEVKGVDISEWAISHADAAMKPFLVCDDLLTTTRLPENHFDCVTLWDIIEQVPEPRRLVAAAAKRLKKDGLFVLLFRDVDSLLSKTLKKKWIHYRPEEKYVYLTQGSAALMLEKEGLKIESIEYANTGKDTTFKNLSEKIQAYNRPLASMLKAMGDVLHLSDKTVHLNFFDTRIAYAKKL